MNIGMLWFDNDTKSELITKVTRAAEYYTHKYGEHPNLCYAHPSMANTPTQSKSEDQAINLGDIEVHLTNSVLPNHLWIGINSLDGNAVKYSPR
jgi:hypothetical protein